jgi:hypothetical protein
MKYTNYDLRDREFWRAERTSGKALAKIYKDNGMQEKIFSEVAKYGMEIAELRHELSVARRYFKMWDKEWKQAIKEGSEK